MATTTVRLQRSDPSQPWGFRIHGGADFNQPLVILKVTAGSLAAQQGLEPGDQIIQISGQDALRLRHREAQQSIISSGNQVVFEVVRGGNANMLLNESPISIQSLKQQSNKKVSSSNLLATMVQSSSSVTTAAVTTGWTGPKFTEESIKESLTSQAQVLDTGAIGVNFIKEEKVLDINKSEVLKMLNEIENERKERAKSPSVPPPCNGSSFGIYMNRHYEASVQAQQPQAPWASQQQLSPSIPPPTQDVKPETVAASAPVEG